VAGRSDNYGLNYWKEMAYSLDGELHLVKGNPCVNLANGHWA